MASFILEVPFFGIISKNLFIMHSLMFDIPLLLSAMKAGRKNHSFTGAMVHRECVKSHRFQTKSKSFLDDLKPTDSKQTDTLTRTQDEEKGTVLIRFDSIQFNLLSNTLSECTHRF